QNFNKLLSTNITNNIMGYNSCRNYLSPMQMGYYHMRANTGVTTKYLTFCDYDPLNTVIVQTSQTWDRSRVIGGDLIINPGVTLTVHCTVSLPEGGKVIVKRGAKLIIDQGIFTNICGQRWKGIQVLGNPSLAQSNTTLNGQGQVIIQNGGSVEKAEVAVAATWIDPISGQPDFNWDGGIIRAQNAFFRNDITGIQLWSYHSPTTSTLNYSYIKNCTFETNSAWPNTSIYPKYFVDLYDVDYTQIIGCTFKNLIPNSFPVGNRGEGIFSVDARFRVGNYCANPPSCTSVFSSTFTNLSYGVDASASMPLLTCTVDEAAFNSCEKGISIRGLDYSTITRNTFNITPGTSTLPHFGIYTENCTGYQIDGNICIGSGSPAYDIGVGIRDSYDMSNIVYNNSFTNLYVGEEALGDNDGYTSSDGLRFNCNDNLNNQYDIFVTNPTLQNNLSTDIGKIQGQLDLISPSAQQLVRNTYSAPCVASNENQFRMDKLSPQGATHYNDLNSYTKPQCKDNRVLTYNTTYTFNKPLDCPTSFGNNPSLSSLQLQLATYTTQISSQKALIDGNNTQGLLNSISSGNPGQIKNTLLAVGPYLSDQVLLATIAKNLPPGILKEIIIPNSPVTDTVKQALNALNIPSGIKNQINAAQTGISERGKLEIHIDQLQFERDILLSSEIRLILNDTTFVDPINKVISIIKQENIPDQKCKLASAYIVVKDYPKADSTLNVIQAQQSNTLDNFCQLNRILIDLRQSIQGCLALHTDSTKTAALVQIASQVDKDGCSNAQALLMKAFSYFYPEDVVFPDENQSFRLAAPDSSQQNIVVSDFKAYPNPANDKLNIDYVIPNGKASAVLTIYDLTGKILFQQQLTLDRNSVQVEMSMLSEGLYLWRIESEGEELHSDKFSIIH
ncbi:MAG: T9SS type A sorting domain-containing protein, partial [Bacteroidetes bacterium]|nr:T9SS type A sorting domain-containing protein [Bacteroidota bacterium]